MRADIEDFERMWRYAEHSSFKVASETDFYRVTIEGFTGHAGICIFHIY